MVEDLKVLDIDFISIHNRIDTSTPTDLYSLLIFRCN